MIESWTKVLDEGKSIDVVYCDYMKAFDKVFHRRLLHKLKICNFGLPDQTWIRSFLGQRKQQVSVNRQESAWKPVTSGSLQG